jgi:uncharacterized membrane protein YbhN (UPF0104 family)
MKISFVLVRQIIGFLLFGTAIVYGLFKTPEEILDINIAWLSAAMFMTLFSLLIQILQFHIFSYHHKLENDWRWFTLFTIRKAVLNTFLPAKAGTLIVINSLTKRYNVSWHEYIYFIFFCGIISILVSIIFLILVLFNFTFSFLFIIFCILILAFAKKITRFAYLEYTPVLFIYAVALYLSFLSILWCILRGLGIDISLFGASYFAIAVNTLAQISVTPGNLGVREIMLGLLAPYLSLPVSIGILAGAILFAIRLLLSSIILILLEGRIIPGERDQAR